MHNLFMRLLVVVSLATLNACGGGAEEAKEGTDTQISSNQAPTISGAPGAVSEGQAFSFVPTVSDPDGDRLTFSISNKPAWLSFSTENGALTGTPAKSDVGVYDNIVLSVSDNKLSAALTFSITVKPIANAAPVISGTPAVAIEEQPFSFVPTASDPDGDHLTFSISNKPAWLSFSTENGALTGTPSLGSAGNYNDIMITVSDGNLAVELPVSITVTAATEITISPTSGLVSAPYFHRLSTAISAQEVSYSIKDLPDWASIDINELTISGIPTTLGSDQITLVAKNSEKTWVLNGTIDVKAPEAYLDTNLIDFYSKTYDGSKRELRNDLTGNIAAEVQFVQSHSVAPNNNYVQNKADETQSRYMPRIVAQREALLLFIPHAGQSVSQVKAELVINGALVEELSLQHPNLLPAADLDNGSSVTYSSNAWWAYIPWQHVRNGLEINFLSDDKIGTLPASAIDIGEASQLVLKSIRLGMLTTPDQSQGHYTLRDPISAATDYFQTIPVSKLVVASYADMSLDRVIISTGKIYDKAIDVSSSTNGDVYSGDMRGDVAKAQVSTGINLADYGYTSNNMYQSYPHVYKQITNHHAWGQYLNGRVAHGLSGGNGIGTLYSSWGNEASHEWGHAYGLGHYPGQGLTADGRWAVHHPDSGWGFIAHRKRMRSNIVNVNDNGSFNYHRDAMSGGSSNSQFSTYTHHTGYSARIIQNNLASLPLADTNFTSGYKKWNTQTGQYEEFTDNNNRPVPVATGVAVATVLGGYDPVNYNAVLYPVFHGNYGNLFNLPAPDLTSTEDQCWVELQNASSETRLIKVAATRHNPASINQLHFNVEAEFKPTLAILNCQHNGTKTELTRTSFDGEIPPLPELAIVGQEHGFDQFKQRELNEIEQELTSLADDVLLLPASLAFKIDSYELVDVFAALSDASSTKLAKMLAYRDAARNTTLLLNHAEAEQLPDSEAADRLRRHLAESGLLDGDNIALTGTEIHGNGYFFDGRNGESSIVALTSRNNVDLADRTAWIRDAYGRIHIADAPWLCITQAGNDLMVQNCSANNQSQRWNFRNGNPLVLQNAASGKCIDYDRANVKLIPYNCHGGWNQQWTGITNTPALWISLLDGYDIQRVMRLLAG